MSVGTPTSGSHNSSGAGIWQGLIGAVLGALITGVFLLWANGRFDDKAPIIPPVPTLAANPNSEPSTLPSSIVNDPTVPPTDNISNSGSEIPTNTPLLPTSVPTESPLPQQQDLVVDSVAVPGNLINGIEYPIKQAGTYVMEIGSGAYSPWKNDAVKNGQWRTFAYIYINRAVKRGEDVWGSGVPVDPDLIIGCLRDMSSQSEAEECGKGQRSEEVALVQGDTLHLVALDERQAYSENRGSLIVRIIKVK